MARASRRPGDPASQKAYVLEVLAAQERLGITDPSSVSSEEAMQMFAAIEREPPEKWTAKLGELAAFVGRTYGELGDKVMLDIVRQAASSPDVGRAAAAVIGQLTGGQVKVGALDDMTRAGDIARIGGAIEDGGITFMTGEGEGWQPVGGADPQKEEKPAPFSLAVPPFDAMQALIQSPERAEEFDTVFGPGSADAVLAAKRSADRGKPIGGGRGGVQQPKTWRQLMEDAYPEMKQIRPTDADIEDPAATAGGQDGAELLSDTSAEDLGGDPKGDRLKIPEGGKRGPV